MGLIDKIVEAIVIAGDAAYHTGEHFGYSGQLTNDYYQKHKWEIRIAVLAATCGIGLPFLRLIELGFYSTLG